MLNIENKIVYLAPKNDLTKAFNKHLVSLGYSVQGYIDHFKEDTDIIIKNSFNENDIVIVCSQRYWKEISEKINTNDIFILDIIDDEYSLIKFKEFDGYKTVIQFNLNNLEIQRSYWDEHLKDFESANDDMEKFGYNWGDPENSKDELGDYLSIKNKLNAIISKEDKVLEIGTLGGKWTKYMLKADKIVCVDINESFIDFIKSRYKNSIDKFTFYVSKGNELKGIKSNSINIVFCIDTLVRVEKEYIFDYIKEVARVLNENGKAIIHFPNIDLNGCKERKFTDLSTEEIRVEVSKFFRNFKLDSKTIVHGTLLYVNC